VTRFLASLLFGVGIYDPMTFLGVAALLIAVALAASYIPRAAPCASIHRGPAVRMNDSTVLSSVLKMEN